MSRLLRATVALLACLAAACAEDHERTNLILISLDTTRSDRLSCYGYERETTPNLDAFAAESLLFADCMAQSTATAPSHMSLFTGHYVRRHNLLANSHIAFPPLPLARVLRANGWRTGGFAGHGSVQEIWGHAEGFDVFQTWTGSEVMGKSFMTRNLPDVIPHALDWIDEAPDEAFFLFVHGYDPHCPFYPPETYQEEFAGWYEGDFDLQNKCGLTDFGPIFESEGGLGGEEYRYLNDMYDSELKAADSALGRFFDDLRERELFDSSLIVFTSDHGEVLGDHGWVGHTRTWEEEIRVPLIVRFPHGEFAGRNALPVQHIDVMPTVLSYLQVEQPQGQQGIDLMPYLRGQGDFPMERMRLVQLRDLKAVRFDRRWKAVFGEDRHEEFESGALFDLENDPHELNNLKKTPAGRQKFRELVDKYRTWERSVAAEDRLYHGIVPVPDPEQMEEVQRQLEALEALGYVVGE